MYLVSHNILIDNLTKLIIEIKKKKKEHTKNINLGIKIFKTYY